MAITLRHEKRVQNELGNMPYFCMMDNTLHIVKLAAKFASSPQCSIAGKDFVWLYGIVQSFRASCPCPPTSAKFAVCPGRVVVQ